MESKQDTKTVAALLELKKQDMLKVNPEYQRGQAWKAPQWKRLIDSVLRGYMIPLFYLHYIKRQVAGYTQEGFEVIDGQQRLDALYFFMEGQFKLFDPVKDEAEARFPAFVKEQPCPWGGKDFAGLTPELRERFLNTALPVVMIETQDQNEVRDLFIRLQAGMPLNSQEKRDAWPGNFTEYILKVGGKPALPRYPGHEFFVKVMKASPKNRGEFRQLCAQLFMLFLARRGSDGERLCEIKGEAIDTFYYKHLDFDPNSSQAKRFVEILDFLTDNLGDGKRKKVIGHEAIHLVLLLDMLWDDYTRNWTGRFAPAFDLFKLKVLQDKDTKHDPVPGEYWTQYGVWTRTNTDRADTIRRRHEYFVQKMYAILQPQLLDPTRLFGAIEKELIYNRDGKVCQAPGCGGSVTWAEAEFHHIEEHHEGGRTILENGALVHGHCHPKGQAAVEAFAIKHRARFAAKAAVVRQRLDDESAAPPAI